MKEHKHKLSFNFPTKKKLDVEFSGIDLSSDIGLLLIKQADKNLKIRYCAIGIRLEKV